MFTAEGRNTNQTELLYRYITAYLEGLWSSEDTVNLADLSSGLTESSAENVAPAVLSWLCIAFFQNIRYL